MSQPFGGDPQAPSALAAPERNQYFYGKMLDVSQFELEQNYLNGKRWLVNRLLAGTGVVSGLAVVPSASGTQLIVQPGVAIDGWGREIVVPSASVAIDPRALTDEHGNPAGTISGAGTVTVGICYQECGVDPAPMMIASCKPDGDCAPSTTREQYVVMVTAGSTPPDPVTCGFADLFEPAGGSDEIPDIHPALSERVSAAATEPSGAGCVVLAQVDLPASGDITDAMIDNTVRPAIVTTRMLLELVFCLAQRVQALSKPAPTPT